MKKFLGIIVLGLLWCNTAQALPECEGNEFDWTNCYGTAVYGSGTYEGEFYDGLSHGKGTMTYLNGDKFVGSWKEGEKDGFGTYYYKDGNSTFGFWYKDGLRKSMGEIFQSFSPFLIAIILILLLKFFAKKFYLNLTAPIKKGIRSTASWKGKASRYDYNVYFLALFLFLGLLIYFGITFYETFRLDLAGIYMIVYFPYAFFILVTGLSLTARRLNDIKQPHRAMIILFIPVIGIIYSLVLCILPSQK